MSKMCVFSKATSCSALTCKRCTKCSFYKTKEDLDKAKKTTFIRLKSLPEDVRNHIFNKYYTENQIRQAETLIL